jgi:hypothetical protein
MHCAGSVDFLADGLGADLAKCVAGAIWVLLVDQGWLGLTQRVGRVGLLPVQPCSGNCELRLCWAVLMWLPGVAAAAAAGEAV